MARLEIELEELDKSIGNEPLEFAPKTLVDQRKEVRKSLFNYRNSFLMTPSSRARLKIKKAGRSQEQNVMAFLKPDEDMTE